MNRFTRYLRRIVYLEDDIDRTKATAAIKKNIAFRGPNVIILACAIFIASVGLNVNSIPVIIGAMLISPVMGPTIGFGLGLGTNDTELLKNSAKNFVVMIVPSIISAIGTIRDNNFAINAERFVQNNKTLGSSYIFDHQVNLSGRTQTLDLYLAGEALDYTAKQILLKNAYSYGLHSDQIIFHEEAAVQNFNKNEVIRDLNEHYLQKIQDLNQKITELEVELAKYKDAEKAAADSTARK